jgi:hypothetical protein
MYPYKRIPENTSESVPAEWGIAWSDWSDNGWMMAAVLFLKTLPKFSILPQFPILILLEKVLSFQLFCLLMATSHTLRTNSTENSINTEDELGTTMNYYTLAEIVGKEKIGIFERTKDFLPGENEDIFTLFRTWEYVQNGREKNIFSDSTDAKIQNENQSLTSNGNDLDFPTGTYDGGERMAADHDVNLESGTPKADNRKSLPAEGSCSNLSGRQYVCSRNSSVARVVSTEYMSEFAVWPDTPKRKGKETG